MGGHLSFTGLDSRGCHVGVADGFDFLDGILDAEIIVDSKNRIEHRNDEDSLFFHYRVEVANIAKQNSYIILGFLHGVLAVANLVLHEFRDEY